MSKLQSLVSDTWRGMIQRRLWPVAVILLAMLVAVPVLLAAEPEPAPAPSPTAAAEEAAELGAQPLVAVASPAERDKARRVLGARKDPFKPTAAAKRKKNSAGGKDASSKASDGRSASSAGAQNPASSGSTGSAGGGSYVAPAPLPSGQDAPESTQEEDKEPAQPAGSLTVRWGDPGDEDLKELELERLDPLPNPDEPLLVYMGLADDGRSAVFMLDAGVTVDGDGVCRPDPEDCETLELATGETEFIEVATSEGTVTYQLDVVEIHGRRAAPTRSALKRAAASRATRRAARSLGHAAPAYRFDFRRGILKFADERE